MTANQWISLFLLLGRLVAVGFAGLVAKKQWRLIKQNNGVELQWYRKLLFILILVLIAGNVLPIIIDAYGLFGAGSFGLLLAYVFSNNLTMIISTVIIWLIYRLSSKKIL